MLVSTLKLVGPIGTNSQLSYLSTLRVSSLVWIVWVVSKPSLQYINQAL